MLYCVLISVAAYSNGQSSSELLLLGLFCTLVLENQALGPYPISEIVLIISLLQCIIIFERMMTKEYYPIYEEVVITVISDSHNTSKIPLFVIDENLNI